MELKRLIEKMNEISEQYVKNNKKYDVYRKAFYETPVETPDMRAIYLVVVG